MRKFALVMPIISVALLALAACSSPASETIKVQDLSGLSHIHSVATDGKSIYVASHHGLYALEDNEWKMRGEDFDIMGLAYTNQTFYASGHPGPGQDLPNPVGVLESKDQGKTWTPLSLTGEIDFHLLEASKANFIGAASNIGEILQSSDGGRSWKSVQVPQFSDMALNPKSENEILIATQNGLFLSNDFAKSFSLVGAFKNPVKIDWNQDFIFVSDVNELFRGSDVNSNLEKVEYRFDTISDINSEESVVVVLDRMGVHASFDSGETFALLASLS
jgi:photosystem II stability/assembly factor-like uncharacterized protein